jgi:hypothetical protein
MKSASASGLFLSELSGTELRLRMCIESRNHHLSHIIFLVNKQLIPTISLTLFRKRGAFRQCSDLGKWHTDITAAARGPGPGLSKYGHGLQGLTKI